MFKLSLELDVDDAVTVDDAEDNSVAAEASEDDEPGADSAVWDLQLTL